MLAERILAEAVRAQQLVDNRDCALDDYLDRQLALPEARRTLTDLLFTVYRYRNAFDDFLSRHCRKRPAPAVLRVLYAALAQVWFQSGIRPESAVNVAVSLVKRSNGVGAANFCNALLHRAVGAGVPSGVPLLPPAVLARWRARFDAETLECLERCWVTPPEPVWRRCAGARSPEGPDAEAMTLPWSDAWRFFRSEAGWSAWFAANAGRLTAGEIYLQDPATTLAVSLAPLEGGERVLDLCAAPGGKTLLLAEQLNGTGHLTACDRSSDRMERLAENLACRNVKAELLSSDGATLPLSAEAKFDYLLADVPCSNTGVFRRRPDALWRFSPEALTEVVELQARLLEAAAARVADGGRLVYSTCSLEPEENQGQLERFLARHREFRLEASELLLPDARHDGAFAGVLRRKKDGA